MAFPTINFKITNTELAGGLKDVTQQKFSSLEKYIAGTACICDVEFEKMTAHQNGDFFRVEANLKVNGTLHRAEATLSSFEKALDEVRDQLDKKLRRSRKKENTLLKRGGRKIKEMLRFGK